VSSAAGDPDGPVAEGDGVAVVQLPTATRFDGAVDEHQPVGDHALGISAAVDQARELQELAESDRIVPDRHVTGPLRHERQASALASRW